MAMIEKAGNLDTNAFAGDPSEWSILIGPVVPAAPLIRFIGDIAWADVQKILSALDIGIEAESININNSSDHVPAELQLNDHGAARLLCDQLAMMQISHDAYFQVGGIWMLQSVVFDNPQASNGIICWPAGECISATAAACILLGLPVPGLQAKLDAIFAAGGYVSADLALLGIHGGLVPSIHSGATPAFAQVKTQPASTAHVPLALTPVAEADQFGFVPSWFDQVQQSNATLH